MGLCRIAAQLPEQVSHDRFPRQPAGHHARHSARKFAWKIGTACLLALYSALTPLSLSAEEPLHILIPAGPGGGLDSTARALGRALQDSGARSPVSFENMIGGGGGRALAHFVEAADRQQNTLLINSTPLLVRSLQGLFPQSFRDTVPLAGLIGEYSVFAVRTDSAITDWSTLIETLQSTPGRITLGGGSVRGSMDHIAIALAARAAGINARALRYLPYDGGGKAILALLGGEIDVLSTGLGETLGYIASNDVRLLAVTAPVRSLLANDVPTLTELGTPLVFANWRGLFAAPGAPPEDLDGYEASVQQALASPAWTEAVARYGWTEMPLDRSAFLAFLEQQEQELKTALVDLGFVH